jgi:hypothetical protein
MVTDESSKPTESTPPPPVSQPAGRLATWMATIETSVLRQLLIVGALGVLIMVGLFLANYSPNWADWYWSAMFPIFGLVCLSHQLEAGKTHGMSAWQLPLQQALHWLGPIVAVRIIFLQLARGQMAADSVALMILLVLAVTAYLAGIHFDRSFVWVSIVLTLAALGGTEIETYLWLIVVLGVLLVALIVFSTLLMRRRTTAGATSA